MSFQICGGNMNYKIKLNVKTIVSLIFVFLVIYFLFQPLFTEKRTTLTHDVSNTENISFSEMDAFLEVWSQYCQKGYKDEVGNSVSIFNENINGAIPKNIQIWLKRRDWTVERFYYVEQRLRAALKEAIMEQHFEHNKNMLQKGGNIISSGNLRKIVAEQDKKQTAWEVSREEIDMMKADTSLFHGIFECRIIYQP